MTRSDPAPRRRIVVVGAGIAGLTAAGELVAAGHEVIVLDKGRGPGGRLATRRIGAATVDHGAQFFTVRSEQFAAMIAPLERDGLVREWCRGFGDVPDGHPRYVVQGGMNALAKRLAAGLDVRCDTLVFAIRRGSASAWSVVLDDASTIDADALVMTCPIPQSFSLLVTAEVAVTTGGIPEALWRTDYDRTIALLAVLDRPSGIRAPGGVQDAPGYTFIGDNQAKGLSAVPAVTMHTDPAWSLANWDEDRDEVHRHLLAAAEPWLGGATVIESQVKRWRFATPRRLWPEPCWTADEERPLVLAGDAFAGPRVEGAALSGAAAAQAPPRSMGRRARLVGHARRVITFDDDLRRTMVAHLAAHRRFEIPIDERRRAAVAIVVVDSDPDADRVDDFVGEGGLVDHPIDMSMVPGDTRGLDGRMQGVSGGAAFLLCRRAAKMNRHAGQWALPGGRLDGDETVEQAALRETHEELGLELPASAVLGRLDDYPTRSGFVISPVVVWGGGHVEMHPDPGEVARVYRIGVHELCRDDSPRFVTIPESDQPVVQLPLGGDLIHAPTAAALVQFRWVALEGRTDARVDHFEQPVFAWK